MGIPTWDEIPPKTSGAPDTYDISVYANTDDGVLVEYAFYTGNDADSSAYSLTYYADIPPVGAVDSLPFSITYSPNYVPGNGADSLPYSMTYGGNYTPIKTVGTDSIGQRCAVLKALGNEAGGKMHFVVRTSGPYGVSDGELIRSGSEAVVFWSSVANMARQQVLVTDLAPATTYYWGATFDTGAASTAGQFTTQQLPADEQGLTPEGIQP